MAEHRTNLIRLVCGDKAQLIYTNYKTEQVENLVKSLPFNLNGFTVGLNETKRQKNLKLAKTYKDIIKQYDLFYGHYRKIFFDNFLMIDLSLENDENYKFTIDDFDITSCVYDGSNFKYDLDEIIFDLILDVLQKHDNNFAYYKIDSYNIDTVKLF